jgi:predicted branched-subunit amino acid permease
VAVVTGVLEGIATLGLAFPISATLFGVAVADVDRVAVLSGYSGSRRVLALWILLTALALLVGLAVPFVLVGIVAGLVVLLWRRARSRSRSRRVAG